MRKLLLPALALACALNVAVARTDAPGGAPAAPLIERAKIFGNPSKIAGRLSPDGQWLSWIAPRDGVLNVWVAPTANLANARPLTAEKTRPIRAAFWSPDSSTVMYINDKGGDENFLLYGVAATGGEPRLLTPFEKTRVRLVAESNKVKDRILIGLNNRDPRWHDLYSLEPASGKLTLLMTNTEGYGALWADDGLTPRVVQKSRKDGGEDYYRVVEGKVEKEPFAQVGMEDVQTTRPLGFTADGKTLYWVDSRGRDKAALLAQDVATLATRVLAEDARADVQAGLADPRTGKVQAYVVNYLKEEYQPLDNAVKGDLAYLRQHLKGQFQVASRTDADDKWLVVVDPVAGPATTYLYQRKPQKLTRLYVSRPELEGARLADNLPLEIPSRDGLTLVSYLTVPPWLVRPDGLPRTPAPMVLLVHGGPWARDGYGYNGYSQWLANRGYAVLSVNFRGSTGFGKKFIAAGDQQWGRKMHDDLIDAVDWAVAKGITTPDKIAIMGGSYGGYATLAGLAFTPTRFACGVDIVGPSNLFTLLKTIPAYWEAGRIQLYKRMGDPDTEEGRALLKERSPLNAADRIVRPLLIGQGANDPRVNVAESDQIVEAMKAKDIPVTYVVFPDEGHGFARPVNNIAFNAVAENFLSQCLGGRAEPIGPTLKASTAQVRHGAEFAPGLKDALQ